MGDYGIMFQENRLHVKNSSLLSKIVRGLIYVIIGITPHAQLEINLLDTQILGSVSRFLGLFATLFFVLNLFSNKTSSITLFKNRYEKPFIFFCAFMLNVTLISFFKVSNYQIYFEAVTKLLMSISLAVIVYYSIYNLEEINKCLLSFLVGFIIISIVGLCNYEESSLPYTTNFYKYHRYGAGTDPNMLALYAIIAIPICLKFLIEAKHIKKLLWLGITLFTVFMLFQTYSRTGIISFFCQMIFSLFLFKFSKSFIKRIGTAIIILLITIIPLYATKLWYVRFYDLESDTRYQLFHDAIDVFSKHPIFGVGYRQFILYSSAGECVHNTFLELATSTGFMGIIVFVIFMFCLWKSLQHAGTMSNTSEMRYKATLKLIFVGIMIIAFFLTLENEKVLWIIIALILCVSRFFQNSVRTLKNIPVRA